MSEPAVLTEVADGVMTITINRPQQKNAVNKDCLLYTSPSPRDWMVSRMPSSA